MYCDEKHSEVACNWKFKNTRSTQMLVCAHRGASLRGNLSRYNHHYKGPTFAELQCKLQWNRIHTAYLLTSTL